MATDPTKMVENVVDWPDDRQLLVSLLEAMAAEIEANREEIERLKIKSVLKDFLKAERSE